MNTDSDSPETAEAPASKAAPAKASGLRKLVLVTAGAAVVAWAGYLGLHAYRYEKTDNAFVIGRLHQVSPQISAQVREVLVKDNELVKSGQALVRLDTSEYEIALKRAQAAVALTEAQQNQASAAMNQAAALDAEARARVTQAEAQIEQSVAQLSLAKLTAERAERLLGSGGAVTQAEVDNARSGLQAAIAAEASARANLVAAQAAVNSALGARESAAAQFVAAQANVTAARATAADAERLLGYTEIRSPANGRVGNRTVESGNRVSTGQTLLAVAESDLWVVANFKETQLERMRPGTAVEMTVDALPDEVLHGKIESLSPASGAQFALLPPDNATGNFNKVVQRVPVKIMIDPADLSRLGDRLSLGFSVVVEVRVR